jgi:hypothetical protein
MAPLQPAGATAGADGMTNGSSSGSSRMVQPIKVWWMLKTLQILFFPF